MHKKPEKIQKNFVVPIRIEAHAGALHRLIAPGTTIASISIRAYAPPS